MKLTIIIPVYNEEKTVGKVIRKIKDISLPGIKKEIIIVDDGSTDATERHIRIESRGDKSVRHISHIKNKGKGAAVRTAFKSAKGEYILIQDADLEYDPSDIPLLLQPILEKRAEVVYGTRLKRMPNFRRDERTLQFFIHYLGNKMLSFITILLYGQMISDMETGYKLFPKKALSKISITANSFDFEPEITAKLIKQGYKIHEVVIKTNPRGYSEGKKLKAFRDGSLALYTLIKYRFT
jgi:dolichol-phosphate mannosyltransferase